MGCKHICNKLRKLLGWALIDICIWLFVVSGLNTTRTIVIVNPAVVEAHASTEAEDYLIGRSSGSNATKGEQQEIAISPVQPDIEAMIRETFPECPDTMIAIARAESHFRTNAVNVNTNGSKDCGIFQVNSIHGYDCEWLFDVENNLKAARSVFDKQGLTAWATYNFAIANGLPI